MIHEKLVIPVRTNHNKLNSSVPFKVAVSGTTKPNVFYDLSTGYLKFKIRMKNVKYDIATMGSGEDKLVTIAEGSTPYEHLYVPSMVPHFIDYVKGYINCVEGDEEVQYSFSDINYEDMCQHACMLDFLNSHPCKFDNQRHIYPKYNGNSGFGGPVDDNLSDFFKGADLNDDLNKYMNIERFQNKIEFLKEQEHTDGSVDYITTMCIPLSSILESASRASLINLKLLDLDFYLYDLAKFIDKIDLWQKVEDKTTKNDDVNWNGGFYVTGDNMFRNDVLNNNTMVGNFDFKDLEIYDCDLYIDQFEFNDMSEYHNMPNTDKGLVVAQVDNHVLDINQQCDINKFTVRVPFKPATCYIYFTYDGDSNSSNRTDYLYLNPPKYLNVKTLTGWSSTYPYYENGEENIFDPIEYGYNNSIVAYKSPDPRLFEELHYVLNKYDTPLINYNSFAQVHRIYAVDMNSHLNLSDNTNELIFEIQFEDSVPEDVNVRMHVIFERDYSK